MRQCSCQRQPLRLSAGKACAAAADDGLRSVLHAEHFILQADGFQVWHGVLLASAQNVVFDRVGAQFRVVPQIANRCGKPARRERGKLCPTDNWDSAA